MFEKLLVPLDGSALAECVLSHVLAIAKAFRSRIILLSVTHDHEAQENLIVDPVDWQIRVAEGEAYVRSVAARMETLGFESSWETQEGHPADCIADAARSRNVDLVVLSTHGKTGLSRWMLGGVARKVVQSAHVSTMLVRAFKAPPLGELAVRPYRRILVPLDGSQRAECVLPHVSKLAEFYEAEVLVVHAVNKPEISCRCPMSPEDKELEQSLIERNRRAASEYLESVRSRLPSTTQTKLIVETDAINSLLDFTETSGADLVIVSAHGYSGGHRRPYGSVCQSLVDYGTSPLLVVQDLPRTEIEPTPAALAVQEHPGH